ncbi:unnamed protein product [Rhizophagus irregularis]|nr:unnamed protein product [Rhizophagus irregularis]
MNEINEYQQDEESQETRETSSFFTCFRASSISDISGESASLSSITSKKRRYNSPGPGGSSKKSFIWKYFSEGANPISPGKVMTCNLNNSKGQPCQKTYTAFGNTSNAIQHLASVHGIVEQGKIHIKAVKSGVIDQMIKNQNKNKWTESQQIVADRKLAKWILNSTSPLDTVNNIYLNEFLAYLNSHYNLPNDKNLKLLIYQAYRWTEESMKKLLSSSAKYISLTTDLWTSRAKQGYIRITASFISIDFKFYDILLELKYVPYSHTSEIIQSHIESTISNWGLRGKVIAIATDNDVNMLVIEKGLKPALVFVARTRRLIQFFMYPKQIERLKETQVSLNYQRVLGVIGDVSTRWNSLFLAWKRLIYLKDAIDQLATDLSRNRDNNVKKDGRRLKSINLIEEEWTFMEELVDLLGLFEEATTFLSGSTYATLSLMHPTISTIKSIFEDDLITNAEGDENNDFSNTITILDNDEDEEDEQEFLEQPEDDDDYVKEIILQALHKYWNIPSDIALKAAFLDPRFKDLTFARNKKDQIIHLIQDELNQVGNLLSEDNPNDDNHETEVTERRGSRRNSQKEKNTLFNRIFSKSSNTNAFENELNQYVNIKCANSDIDLCEWWAEKKQIFPLLSDLARKYLHIPATSVPSEQLFSDTGNHVSVRQTRFDPNLLRTIVFLKRNMKAMDIFPPDE